MKVADLGARPTYLVVAGCVVAMVSLWPNALLAQTIYRLDGADGRVTFSDTVLTTTGKAQVVGAEAGAAAGGGATLPFELRQVVSRYPVVLYTSANCAPCGSGRAFLGRRGIPFNEKTVTTPNDTEALKRISGEASLPLLTIGSQQVKGYSDVEWGQFLDAAGYPKSSALPSSYRAPQATPLVALQEAAPEKAPPQPTTPSAPPIPRAQPPNPAANPAGITF